MIIILLQTFYLERLKKIYETFQGTNHIGIYIHFKRYFYQLKVQTVGNFESIRQMSIMIREKYKTTHLTWRAKQNIVNNGAFSDIAQPNLQIF